MKTRGIIHNDIQVYFKLGFVPESLFVVLHWMFVVCVHVQKNLEKVMSLIVLLFQPTDSSHCLRKPVKHNSS